jgi:hypothetical protein
MAKGNARTNSGNPITNSRIGPWIGV